MAYNAYYNGEFKNKSDISVSLTDRALFFGDGIYDAAIGRNGKIFMLDAHLDRFISNAKALAIPLLPTRSELEETILKTVELSGEKSYFVYFQLSRFSEERVHAAKKVQKSNLLITVTQFSLCDENKILSLIIRNDVRHSLCHIKTLNLIPSVISSMEALEAGADEAVFIRDGIVTECSHSNIHIVKNGTVITHPTDCHILPGISRAHMLSVCRRLKIPYEEREFSADELLSADEVIVTSSSKLALPVQHIADKVYNLSEGNVSRRICKAMRCDYLNATE